ncbi:hypothetical protein [Pseudomonas sp. VI4.1]|jgi:hypothetical protein|uniref:hypothetical protein n=1 Tax=Pseudomonas sp. VI4.1 TaxID=1941346 RepID=UPI00143CF33B
MEREVQAAVEGQRTLAAFLTTQIETQHIQIFDQQNTFNQKDFPREVPGPFGIEAQHPDQFVDNLFDLDPAAVIAAAQRQRKQLKMPPIDVNTYLDLLLRQGLVQSSKALTLYAAIL